MGCFFMQEYLRAIYQHVSNSKTKEEILSVLSQIGSKNFEFIMHEIIQRMENEKRELMDMSDDEVKEIIAEIDRKIILCIAYLNENSNAEDAISNFQNIIYATSGFGNNLIEADISSISEEYYSDILDILHRLQMGFVTSDYRKQRKFTNNQGKQDVFEQKQNAIRIFYKKIDNDFIYVFSVRLKRTDWGAKENEQLMARLKNINDEFDRLTEMFKNPFQKDLIIKQNKTVHKNILGYLDKNKRGGKKYSGTKTGTERKALQVSTSLPSKKSSRVNKYDGLDSYWKIMYKLAKTIYENRGTINIPAIEKIRGVEIGKWLLAQKKNKAQGLLSELQIGLLDELGIDWTFNGLKGRMNKNVRVCKIVTTVATTKQLSSNLIETAMTR